MSQQPPVATVLEGDALAVLRGLPDEAFAMVMTSPPYFGMRDYGAAGQFGLERSVEEYVANMVQVFREVRRVLRKDGTIWVNIGDSYASSSTSAHAHDPTIPGTKASAQRFRPPPPSGYKPKDLLLVPFKVAEALRADGWYLRGDIIWEKPNAKPESCHDRPSRSHEYLWMLSKSRYYHFDQDAVREPHKDPRTSKGGDGRAGKNSMRGESEIRPRGNCNGDRFFNPKGRNVRTVWNIATRAYKGAHCAVFPPELCRRPILAGSRLGDTVLDPFSGAGTTGVAALALGRSYVGIELNPASAAEQRARLAPVLNAALGTWAGAA